MTSPRRSRGMVRLLAATIAALAIVPVGTALGAERVVVLSEGADARAIATRNAIAPAHLFDRALDAFSADLSPAQAARLGEDPAVQAVVPDPLFTLAEVSRPQAVGAGIARIGGPESPGARVDGVDERVDADIAVIDSGVHSDHPDLNVAGGVDCANAESTEDVDGHGTFMAGIAAGIDNGIGIAGVAPGARVWSVRVADRRGEVRGSYILCALDWVAEHADVVDVANLSLGGPGEDLGGCGRDPLGVVLDPIHAAICAAVEAGVTITVAAGNDAVPAAGTVPAAYDEVITVSAYADFDGLPGGLAPPVCLDEPLPDLDDALAPFSNHGRDVDIAAPGVCIESTVPGGYAISDGTSIAAPFVAGAAALVKAAAPSASPAEVRETLIGAGEPGPIPLDPDAFPEPLLDVRSL